MVRLDQTFYLAGFNQWLSPDENLGGWWIKDAFPYPDGYFEYQVMLFSLSNVPASFQGYINKILAKKPDIFVSIYLDDIFIYTKDLGQGHVEAV